VCSSKQRPKESAPENLRMLLPLDRERDRAFNTPQTLSGAEVSTRESGYDYTHNELNPAGVAGILNT